LYKFTEDGRFSCAVQDEQFLNKALLLVKNSQNPDNLKTAVVPEEEYPEDPIYPEDPFYPEDPISKCTVLNEEITPYVNLYRVIKTGNSSINNRPITTPKVYSVNQAFEEPQLWNEVKGWEASKGRETWCGSWFGDRRVSYAYISKHRRAKVIYTNQDFGIWGTTGIQVKYQKKGSGVWWRYKADELVLGVNEISHVVKINTNNIEKIPKDIFYYENKYFNDHLADITYKVDKYPKWPFETEVKVVLNLYAFGYNKNVKLSSEQLTDMAYGLLSGEVTRIFRNNGKNESDADQISVMAFAGDKIYFTNLDYSKRKKNSRRINKSYSKKAQTPTITYDMYDNIIGVKFEVPDLITNETLKMDFYGGARRGTTWKGTRIVYP